ncbi:MAG: zinc ABC transporter substrate-binding protein, partial [Alphaproteobacteria bacterium]|nr:zinc ABC transporter substrate-binding protein [Alphaproteobacteria bacterium]
MKRTALAAALAVALLSPAAADAEVRILACEPEWAALAEEIGGDDVVVHSATHGSQDAHHIRARPSLIAKVRRASVLFCSGADLEVGWLPVLLERGAGRILQPGQPGHIMAADHVEVLEHPTVLDRSLGDIHPGGNPHVHLDPRNVSILGEVLADRLSRIDPERASAYWQRLISFQARWAEAMVGWRARADALDGMKVFVHHKAWVYLLRWAGLERVSALERVSGVPPTASHLAEVLELARNSGAKAILRAPYDPENAA